MTLRRLAVALLVLLSAGCGGGSSGGESMAVGTTGADAVSTLAAHLYAAALRSYGTPAHVESVPDPLVGLDAGTVDVAPAFTGRLLHTLAPEDPSRAATQVYRDMVAALPEGLTAGDYTESAEDKPALSVTEATADSWGGRDVTAAVRNCDRLVVGKTVGAPRPATIGTCKPDVREYSNAAKLFAALRSGQVNAAWTSTADPGIPDDVVVLTDRTALIRAENLVPVYRRNELTESQVLALNAVAGQLDTATLVQMLRKVSTGADAQQVADGFIAEHPLGATSR